MLSMEELMMEETWESLLMLEDQVEESLEAEIATETTAGNIIKYHLKMFFFHKFYKF